jgi:hypothetical protein
MLEQSTLHAFLTYHGYSDMKIQVFWDVTLADSPEDDGPAVILNSRNSSPSDTEPHLRSLESLTLSVCAEYIYSAIFIRL